MTETSRHIVVVHHRFVSTPVGSRRWWRKRLRTLATVGADCWCGWSVTAETDDPFAGERVRVAAASHGV